MSGADYIPFLNWQFIYCWIISLFGARCQSDVVPIDVSGVGTAVGKGVGDATSQVTDGGFFSRLFSFGHGGGGTTSDGGFWSWLWPFGSSAGDASTNAGSGADSVSLWSSLFHSLPEPVQAVLSFIGIGLGFLWTLFSWLSFAASSILFLGIVAGIIGLLLIRIREWEQYGTLPPRDTTQTFGYSRWQDMLNAAMSTDPKLWRAAIMAADGMLGELLTKLGYAGDTTGEQLRRVPDDAFVTVGAAWEAHRIKNFIAARSSDYILTQREAFRVMKLYEQVFEEFDFI